MIVFDQNRVIKTKAVIEPATCAHGIFFHGAQTRCRFARIANARGGVGHYATSMGTQFSEPGVALVVPPGKGGIDMTRSVVPLGSMNSGATPSAYPTPAAHTGSAYMGAQLPNGLQPRCPSRGSLGARGGKQLIR